MKRLRALITLVSILLAAGANAADDLGDFYSSLRTVFNKHYPEVTVSTNDKTTTFDHDTRLFLIHAPLKTGEWQDAAVNRFQTFFHAASTPCLFQSNVLRF